MMTLPSHFYAIVDPLAGHDPVALAQVILEAGARIVQLRMKQASGRELLNAARAIYPLCRRHDALLIVNDRPDIAILAGAEGVHLGQDDIPLRAGRRLMGQASIIGISTHSVEQALAAEQGGASYIGFGPIYPGGTKQVSVERSQGLDRLRAVRAAVHIPIVAIGGITEQTMAQVLAAGADGAAIITDVVHAADITAKVKALLAIPPERAV